MLKSRFEDHLSRKIFHMFSGTIIAYLFVSTLSRNQTIFAALVSVSILGAFDLLRLRWPRLNRFVLKIYGPLMRETEDERPSGQFYYLLGVGFAVLFLPKPIAIQSILTLAWMDPSAALFGRRFGRRSWTEILGKFFIHVRHFPKSVASKTMEGSFAGLVAAMLAGVAAWTGPWAAYRMGDGPLHWPETWQIILLSFVGGLSSMIAEAWPTQWDDNVNIPFWSGIFVWAAVKIIGLPVYFG